MRMPFSIMQTNIQLSIFKNSINQINQREEYDFFLAHQAPIRKPQKNQKRVSAFTASITVDNKFRTHLQKDHPNEQHTQKSCRKPKPVHIEELF